MGYTMKRGRWADTDALDLSPAAALAADETTPAVELGDRAVARLVLDVTAVSADDTLDVTVETSSDGVTWYTAATFTQVTAVGAQRKVIPVDRYVRAKYDVTGTTVAIACTLKGEAA